MSTQPTLFDAIGLFALWARESARQKWRLIGTADTRPEALALMDGAGIRGGDWILVEGKGDPNRPRPSATITGHADTECAP